MKTIKHNPPAVVLMTFLAAILLMLSCSIANTNKKTETDKKDPCYEVGKSYQATGKFNDVDPGWTNTKNSVVLQYNTGCTDVYGYADLVQKAESGERIETLSFRLSFKGTFDTAEQSFSGTVYVDHSDLCENACEGFDPYYFQYPANWSATTNKITTMIEGMIDGIGTFKLDSSTELEGDTYRKVPYLELWPKP